MKNRTIHSTLYLLHLESFDFPIKFYRNGYVLRKIDENLIKLGIIEFDSEGCDIARLRKWDSRVIVSDTGLKINSSDVKAN